MLIKEFAGKRPVMNSTARLAENCTLIGDVTLLAGSNIWYGAVLRGDVGSIVIGENSNVQDNSVLHCTEGMPLVLGRGVTVGHGAILHSCTVEDDCLIGMGATVLDGAVIGAGSIVGAGALVSPGKVIPPRSLVVGVPGKVVREVSDENLAESVENANHYVVLGQEQLLSPEQNK